MSAKSIVTVRRSPRMTAQGTDRVGRSGIVRRHTAGVGRSGIVRRHTAGTERGPWLDPTVRVEDGAYRVAGLFATASATDDETGLPGSGSCSASCGTRGSAASSSSLNGAGS